MANDDEILARTAHEMWKLWSDDVNKETTLALAKTLFDLFEQDDDLKETGWLGLTSIEQAHWHMVADAVLTGVAAHLRGSEESV